MGAAFGDAAFVEQEDDVGVAHGGDAVRDDDRRPLPHHAAQPRQDLFFGVGIDRRQRVVQDQDAGIDDDARAIAVRCFWPPESVMPRSPTIVS